MRLKESELSSSRLLYHIKTPLYYPKQATVGNHSDHIAINDGNIIDNAAQILSNMVNISSNANTITNIDGYIHDNTLQIEALNVSLF